jgi:hypothetical protein
VTRFVEVPAGQFENCLCRLLFTGSEVISIEFKKQDSHHETCALAAIDKGVVAYDTPGVSSGHGDDIRGLAVCEVLLWSSESFGENVEGTAVSADDVIGLRHFLLEFGIVPIPHLLFAQHCDKLTSKSGNEAFLSYDENYPKNNLGQECVAFAIKALAHDRNDPPEGLLLGA